MIRKWKEAVDKYQYFRALLTDLSKSPDCISHEFLITKLHSYGIFLASLKLITDCLKNRTQISKSEISYSS